MPLDLQVRRAVAGKARVHELAKELGVTSKEVLNKLAEQGEYVKSASSTVEAPVVRRYQEKFPVDTPPAAPSTPKPAGKAAAPAASGTPAAPPAPAAPGSAPSATPGPKAPAAPAAPAPAPCCTAPCGRAAARCRWKTSGSSPSTSAAPCTWTRPP